MKTRRGCGWLLLVLVLVSVAPWASAAPTEVLLEAMDQTAADWIEDLVGFSDGLVFDVFVTLARIQIVLFAVTYIMKNPQGDPVHFALTFGRQLFFLVVLWVGLNYWGLYGPLIHDFFIAIGYVMTDFEGFNPTEIMHQGFGVILDIYSNPRLLIPSLLTQNFLNFFSLILITFSYLSLFVVSIRILGLSYISFTTGPLFMVFAAWKRTSGIADGWMKMALKSGIEMLGFYLTMYLGREMAVIWMANFNDISIFRPDLQIRELWLLAFGFLGWAILATWVVLKMGQIADSWQPNLGDFLAER